MIVFIIITGKIQDNLKILHLNISTNMFIYFAKEVTFIGSKNQDVGIFCGDIFQPIICNISNDSTINII